MAAVLQQEPSPTEEQSAAEMLAASPGAGGGAGEAGANGAAAVASEALRPAKRARRGSDGGGGDGDGGGGDHEGGGGEGSGRAASPAAGRERRQQRHGHGHLRTHHAVDEEEDGQRAAAGGGGGGEAPAAAAAAAATEADKPAAAAAAAEASGGAAAALGSARPAAGPDARALNAGGADGDAHRGPAKGQHGVASKPSKAKPQLSFADELEDEEGDGGPGEGGGGLRAATASRFREEKKRAAQQAGLELFRRRSGDGDAGGGGSGGTAGEGHGGAVALVDDDAVAGAGPGSGGLDDVEEEEDDDDEGRHARAGSAAPRPGSPRTRRLGSSASLGRLHFGMAQARGLRPYMEDRHTVVASLQLLSSASGGGAQAGPPLPHDGVPRSYAAIFDGHNGAGAAELAAARLHVLLAAHPALRIHTGEPGPPAVARAEEVAIAGALRSAFGTVDEATLAVARREGVRDGATALVVLRLGQVVYAAHAGDSRAVLCRDGCALRLTEDHKPHLPRERARIEDAGGRVDFQRCWRVVVEPRDGRPGSGLAVSRSLGDLDFKEPHKFVECEPDVLRVQLRPLTPSGFGDEFIILGSDGLWDVLSDEDAVHTAKRALQEFKKANSGAGSGGSSSLSDAGAKAAADALLEESLRRGTADNVTCVVMLLAWSTQ